VKRAAKGIVALMLCLSVGSWSRPVLVGHRGGSESLPENSMPSFEAAMRYTRHIELDIRFTLDHIPIIWHDRTLDRMSDCSGLVSETLSRDLGKCQLHLPDSLTGLTLGIPTFASLLRNPRLRRARFIVEIKDFDKKGIDFFWKMARHRKGLYVSSFDLEILQYLAQKHGARHLYYITRSLPGHLPDGIEGILIESRHLDATHATLLKKRYRVYVWTVNHPEEISRLMRLPIVGIITDCLPRFSRTNR
jgi:glycerophosphoryl diester phosphodiesterase